MISHSKNMGKKTEERKIPGIFILVHLKIDAFKNPESAGE